MGPVVAGAQDRPHPDDRGEELWRSLFLQSTEAELIATEEGWILEANPRAEDLLGASRHELRNRSVWSLFAADWLLPGQQALEILHRAGATRFETRIVGETPVVGEGRESLPAEISASLVHLGERCLLRLVLRAGAQRSQLREELRQAQKMEAVGRLAGGLAHDFNNLLTAILGYSDALVKDVGVSGEARGYVLEIRRAGERAEALIRQLLAFSRRQVLRPRPLDLAAVVGDLDPMLRRLIGEDVELETRASDEPAWVVADCGQMEQVIVNLVVNARDAMPCGGTLLLETGAAEVAAEQAARHPGFHPGSYCVLTVKDDGEGMDEVTRERMFEPFFTTKERSKGTGLGLSTVYGIVKQSGGYVYAESAPGRGTTFRIFLPRVEPPAPLPERPLAQPGVPRQVPGSETVLVVEDEEALRGLVRMVLQAAGYQVLEASGGLEALRVVERTEGRIDLLLTDVVIPGVSGRKLAAEVARRRPEIRILFMSGYSDDVLTAHGAADAAIDLLAKPFTAAGLTAKVREVLDRP